MSGIRSSLIGWSALSVLALCVVGAAQQKKTSGKTEPQKAATEGGEPGLLGHWEFEVIRNGITPDSSGNMFHGELVTGCGDNGQLPLIRAPYAKPGFYAGRQVDGRIGKAMECSEMPPPYGNYVRILGSANQSALNFADKSFSLALWSDNPGHVGTQMAQADRNGTHGIGIWGGVFTMADLAATAAVPFFPGGAPPAGQWHHLAATYEAKSRVMTAYLDGRPVGTATTDKLNMKNIVFPDEEWLIGARYMGRAGTLGKFDDVRIYDRTLTQGQVQALASGKP